MFTADTYRVTLDTNHPEEFGTRVLELTVMWADQLAAEEEMPRLGIGYDRPLAMMTVWCWCAAVRVGEFAGTFEDFRRDCLDLTKVAKVPVDPTRLVPAGSPSNLPASGPAQPPTIG